MEDIATLAGQSFTTGFEAGVKAEQERILLLVADLVRCHGTGTDTVRRDDVIRKIQSRHTQMGAAQDPIASRRSV